MRKVGTPKSEASQPEKADLSKSIPTEGNTFAIDRDDMRRSVGNDRRGYVWPLNSPDPRIYMGVTSALNSIPKQAIPYWAARTVAETAVDNIDTLKQLAETDRAGAIRWLKGSPWGQRDKAADIGTAVHTITELDLLGESAAADAIWSTLDKVGKNKAKQVRAFFATVPLNVTHVEGIVYSDEHGYAGTLDFIIEFDDPKIVERLPIKPDENGRVTLLVDLKTSKGVYPETALQLAAYRHADFLFDMNTGERAPMPSTDGAAVLHVTEESWSLIPMDADGGSFDAFLTALKLSKHVPLSKELVGIPSLKGKAAGPKPIPKMKAQEGPVQDLRGL